MSRIVQKKSINTPKASMFCFDGYTLNYSKKTIYFHYSIKFTNRPPLKFTETLVFPLSLKNVKKNALDVFLQPLLIILGISYYKLYIPHIIQLSFPLSKEQALFWNTVYRKGLGEFLFKNKLNPKKIATFPYIKTDPQPVRIPTKESALLGIGGGKDSIVAAELLRNMMDVTSYLLETQREDSITKQVVEIIGFPSYNIRRTLDPQLFNPNPGSYNGHIPISAIIGFIGILLAALDGRKYMIVGNAHSSNIGNTTYKNESINHQWSKSAEFEEMMQKYIRTFITPDVVYMSLLRQFYEIRVVKIFSKYPQYLTHFTSCNKNFTVFKNRPDTLWCGTCAKCAYMFLILAAFIPQKSLINIFKKNLLEDESLFTTYQNLLGFGTLKPFDCVGTFEESQAALSLAAKHYPNSHVVKELLPRIHNQEAIVKSVMSTVPASTLPTPFRFLGIQNIAIIGYGKEGKVTEQYLKRYYPHLNIGILDQSTDPDYLKKQKNYDLAIKTPGLPKTHITIPYTTATNIFFSRNHNFTIGITGSKGKSTTTSLIYEILKTAGKKVRIIGNIGNPMLEVLLTDIDPEEIFVIELSSYMLDDIEYSPNIALLLNLFPEHMDYHGSITAYYNAKRSIFTFQKTGDIALRSPFKETIPLPTSQIPLLGSHNRLNIKAAIAVARQFHIKDKTIQQAIQHFKPLPHRLEYVGTFGDIRFYDDAISTTPESTIQAIKALRQVDTIFLGGTDRGYDFSELETILHQYHVNNIVLFPESGNRILSSEKGFTVLRTDNMNDAVQFAFKNTAKRAICLLSTASPSYSLWKNFEEKGDLFQEIVKNIGNIK